MPSSVYTLKGWTLSLRPPVSRTMGMDPYRMAIIWERPQGSNWLGMRNMSVPA